MFPSQYQKPSLFICSEFIGDEQQLIFWSPNAKTFPVSSLPDRNAITLEYYVVKDLQKLHWSMNKMPHIMFTPLSFKFQGPLFDRLAISQKTVPMICIGILWYLLPDIGRPWQHLAAALTAIANTLYDKGCVLFSLGYTHHFPELYGYTKGHLVQDVAWWCTLKSWDSFIELVGLCSHAIALYRLQWKDALAKQSHIFHPAWVDTLAKSIVCDFSIERAGVIVKPSSCEWLRWILRHMKMNVPIYILWGLVTNGIPHLLPSQAPHVKLPYPKDEDMMSFWQEFEDALAWNTEQDEDNIIL
jgi:hypothetical protein